jgi:uncharacterized protein YndB with AHSA1/START domain
MIRKEIVLPADPDEVWDALTEPDRLEDWFANDVELDLRPGGGASFRWDNGEERHATVTEIEPGRRLAFAWEGEGTVEFTLDDDPDGTRLVVVESSPAWSTALELQACALARV